MDGYPKKLLEQFQDQRQLYEDFCQAIYKLLNGLLQVCLMRRDLPLVFDRRRVR